MQGQVISMQSAYLDPERAAQGGEQSRVLLARATHAIGGRIWQLPCSRLGSERRVERRPAVRQGLEASRQVFRRLFPV